MRTDRVHGTPIHSTSKSVDPSKKHISSLLKQLRTERDARAKLENDLEDLKRTTGAISMQLTRFRKYN